MTDRCWRTNKVRFSKRNAERRAGRLYRRLILRFDLPTYCRECGAWHLERTPR